MAVGQNQWYHFGVGAPPILVYFSGDWDVHWGYGLLTHGWFFQSKLQRRRRIWRKHWVTGKPAKEVHATSVIWGILEWGFPFWWLF